MPQEIKWSEVEEAPPDIFSQKIGRLQKKYQNKFGVPLKLTGEDTAIHKRLHGAGRAADISVKGTTPEEREFVTSFLTRKGIKAADYSDPAHHPKAWTGPHIHAQLPDEHNPPGARANVIPLSAIDKPTTLAAKSTDLSQFQVPGFDAGQYGGKLPNVNDDGFWQSLAHSAGVPTSWQELKDVGMKAALGMDPITQTKDLWNVAVHGKEPQTISGSILAAQVEELKKAKKLYKSGDTMEAIGHTGAGLLPIFGPTAATAGEQLGRGNIKGAAGTGVGLIGQMVAPKILGKLTKGKAIPLEAVDKDVPRGTVPKPKLTAEQFKEWQAGGFKPDPDSPMVGAPVASGGSGAKPTLLQRMFPGKTPSPTSPRAPGGLRAGVANVFSPTGLHRLRVASPKGFRAALATASSREQVKVMMKSVVPQIEKATGMDWRQFASVLGEGRLRGAQQRFMEFSEAVRNAPDEEITASLADPHGFGRILDSLANTHNFPSSLRQQALANLVEGPHALRAFLIDTFDQAAAKTGHFRLGNQPNFFDVITKTPEFQEGLKLYKDNIEKILNKGHAANEGIFSDALGPLDTYIPMIARDAEGAVRGRTGIGSRFRAPMQKPKNPAKNFFTGQATDYSVEVEDFRSQVQGALRSNNMANLITVLEGEGWISPDTGREVPAGYRRVDAGPLRRFTTQTTDIREPASRATPSISQVTKSFDPTRKSVFVPDWLARELEPILKPGEHAVPQGWSDFVGKATGWAIKGLAEPAFHSNKLLKDLTTGTPFIGQNLASKTVGNIPMAKYLNTVIQVATTDLDSADALRIQGKLAEAGVIPSRWGEAHGGPLAKALFGEHGLDMRARMEAYKVLEQVHPNPTPEQVFDFVGQLGIYNRQLEGGLARVVKDLGAGTFYSAGSSRLGNGLRAWAGKSKLPPGHPAARVVQAISGGATGTVLTWFGVYKAYTGKWPWQDGNRAKLLEIPLNEKDRQSKVGQLMFGKGNDTAYVGLDWSSHVAGGARALGLSAGYNNLTEGGTWGQGGEAAVAQSLSSLAQPAFSGPITHDIGTATLGVSPYISSLRDPITGRFGPQFGSTVQTKKPGLPQMFENFKEAAIGTNSFIRTLGGNIGVGEQAQKTEGQSFWGKALRMTLDLAAPGLIKGHMDIGKKRKRIMQQEKAAEHTERKQERKHPRLF